MALVNRGYFQPGQAGASQMPFAVPPVGAGGDFGGLLARQMALREKMAALQMAKMQQDMATARQQAEMHWKDWKRAQYQPGAPGGIHRMSPADEAKMMQMGQEKAMAEALYNAPGSAAKSTAGGWENLLQSIHGVGPEKAWQGMMQTGQLLANPSAAAVPATAMGRIMETTGAQPGLTGGAFAPGGMGRMRWYPQTFAAAQAAAAAEREANPQGSAKGGTVPKTGTYKLHEGEMVVPKKAAEVLWPYTGPARPEEPGRPKMRPKGKYPPDYELRGRARPKSKPIRSYQQGTIPMGMLGKIAPDPTVTEGEKDFIRAYKDLMWSIPQLGYRYNIAPHMVLARFITGWRNTPKTASYDERLKKAREAVGIPTPTELTNKVSEIGQAIEPSLQAMNLIPTKLPYEGAMPTPPRIPMSPTGHLPHLAPPVSAPSAAPFGPSPGTLDISYAGPNPNAGMVPGTSVGDIPLATTALRARSTQGPPESIQNRIGRLAGGTRMSSTESPAMKLSRYESEAERFRANARHQEARARVLQSYTDQRGTVPPEVRQMIQGRQQSAKFWMDQAAQLDKDISEMRKAELLQAAAASEFAGKVMEVQQNAAEKREEVRQEGVKSQSTAFRDLQKAKADLMKDENIDDAQYATMVLSYLAPFLPQVAAAHHTTQEDLVNGLYILLQGERGKDAQSIQMMTGQMTEIANMIDAGRFGATK